MEVPVAVFDLDGCLIESPTGETITDPNYWHKHFTNGDCAYNREMIDLAEALQNMGWRIVVLTARPTRYRDDTQNIVYSKLPGSLLIMYGGGYADASEWKAKKVRELIDAGWDVRFVIEDYKPNAEAIRKVVPVLLYEKVRR